MPSPLPKNYLQLNAVRSPCEECDHHKQGLTKRCNKCRTCKNRIAYNDYVDSIMDGTQASMFEQSRPLIISTAKYKEKTPEPKKEPEREKPTPKASRLGRPISIDWEDVKREYIKKVVPKKMTMAGLAKIFDINAKNLQRKRKSEGWPDKKATECNTEGCKAISWCKGKCKKCYQRKYMRQRLGIAKEDFRK